MCKVFQCEEAVWACPNSFNWPHWSYTLTRTDHLWHTCIPQPSWMAYYGLRGRVNKSGWKLLKTAPIIYKWQLKMFGMCLSIFCIKLNPLIYRLVVFGHTAMHCGPVYAKCMQNSAPCKCMQIWQNLKIVIGISWLYISSVLDSLQKIKLLLQ